MAILECVNLDRTWGRIVPDRPPRSQSEFHALHVVTRGIDALFAGREPDQEFRRNFMEHPLVQEGILKLMPTGEIQ